MIQKWKIREKARLLRKRGWTYPEIQSEIPAHKTTLSRWCRDIKLNKDQIQVRGRLYVAQIRGAKANQRKRAKEIRKIEKEASRRIKSLNNHTFRVAGAMLYWAEGGNRPNDLSIANSDPNMIKFITKWFKKICSVPEEKFKAVLYLHTGLNESRTKKYWSKITGIPINQFGKSILKQEGSASRKYSSKVYRGTIKIQIFDTNLKHRISAWIEQIWAASSIGSSNGLLNRRFRVRSPGGPHEK